MTIATVKFISDNRTVDYIVKPDQFKIYDTVIVDNEQIEDLAHITNIYKIISEKKLKHEKGVGKIIRRVTSEDLIKLRTLKEKALSFLPKCKEKIRQNQILGMNIIDADLSFDDKKLTFYFSAESRIDFRNLVTDFVRSFKKLIRLQQIGARDKAKRIGGFGKCGRQICCSTFLQDYDSVNLDLAKEQRLIDSGTGKISGNCGKLMCCLAYEVDNYKEVFAKMPPIGSKLKTKSGEGIVIEQNALKNTVTVRLNDKTKLEVHV